jgi:hypothetical protein
VARLPKILIILALVGGLLSCDVFFASKGGRYNYLDPKNELVEVFPVIDGYVDMYGWHELDSILVADNNIPSAIVMRFNINEIPDDFDKLYLRLYHYSATESVPISIHPILFSDPIQLGLYYSEIEQAGFYDEEIFAWHTVSPTEGFEYIPLDSIVSGSVSTIRNGVVIFSESDTYSATFASMDEPDEAAWRPRLYITTK